MAAIANITVFDGAATPVSHTLVAESVTRTDGEITAVWREKLASLPNEAQVSAIMRMRQLKSGVYRCELVVDVPVMESVSGSNSSGYTAAPKVAFIDRATMVFYHSPRSTVTGRRLARQLCLNLAGSISTSVAPASAGPLPEMVDQLIMPT